MFILVPLSLCRSLEEERGENFESTAWKKGGDKLPRLYRSWAAYMTFASQSWWKVDGEKGVASPANALVSSRFELWCA